MGSTEIPDAQDPDTASAAGSASDPAVAAGSPSARSRLTRNMLVYTGLRLLLVVAITLVIIGIGLVFGVRIPVFFAGLVAVIIALPLSMVLFTRLRTEINRDIAAVDSGRREKRESLNRRMRG